MIQIDNKDIVSKDMIETYSEIDGIEVIKDFLLLKGVEYLGIKKDIPIKILINNAIAFYGLKNSSTNKLYVAYYLERSLRKNFIRIERNAMVIVPDEIYNEVKKKNEDFIRHR